MDKTEYDIMRDAFTLLKNFATVPTGIKESGEFFKRLSEESLEFCNKWDNHELAVQMGVAINMYLESKYKAAVTAE